MVLSKAAREAFKMNAKLLEPYLALFSKEGASAEAGDLENLGCTNPKSSHDCPADKSSVSYADSSLLKEPFYRLLLVYLSFY